MEGLRLFRADDTVGFPLRLKRVGVHAGHVVKVHVVIQRHPTATTITISSGFALKSSHISFESADI